MVIHQRRRQFHFAARSIQRHARRQRRVVLLVPRTAHRIAHQRDALRAALRFVVNAEVVRLVRRGDGDAALFCIRAFLQRRLREELLRRVIDDRYSLGTLGCLVMVGLVVVSSLHGNLVPHVFRLKQINLGCFLVDCHAIAEPLVLHLVRRGQAIGIVQSRGQKHA